MAIGSDTSIALAGIASRTMKATVTVGINGGYINRQREPEGGAVLIGTLALGT